MKKILLFEEFNRSFNPYEEDLNENLKTFFNKISYYTKRLSLESKILFIKIFLPLIASGVNEKDLLKADIKKLIDYWRKFLKENPSAKIKGLRTDVLSNENSNTSELKTYAEFYRWLEKEDKDFAENYMGGELKNVYNDVISKAKELEAAMDKYKSKNKKDIDYILNN